MVKIKLFGSILDLHCSLYRLYMFSYCSFHWNAFRYVFGRTITIVGNSNDKMFFYTDKKCL